jgi:hypothetical protein
MLFNRIIRIRQFIFTKMIKIYFIRGALNVILHSHKFKGLKIKYNIFTLVKK